MSETAPMLDWADLIWSDADGGTVHLHGVLPSVVLPRSLRPEVRWDGLALIEPHDVEEAWAATEAEEAEERGANLAHARFSGGLDGEYLDRLMGLEGCPEVASPTLSRGDCNDWPCAINGPPTTSNLMRRMRHGMICSVMRRRPSLTGGRCLGRCSNAGDGSGRFVNSHRMRSSQNGSIRTMRSPPCSRRSGGGRSNNDEARMWRDGAGDRIAGRLRGALADLRSDVEDPVLLLPMIQSARQDLIEALERASDIERLLRNEEPSEVG